MSKNKLLIGILTSIVLATNSTILMAQSAAVSSTATAGTSAQKSTETPSTPQENATSATVSQSTAPPPSLITRARSSFYGGIGISMLNDRGYTGLMPKAFAGYGRFLGKCKAFYGAAEVFGGVGSLRLSSNRHYDVRSVLGVSVIPGVLMDEWTMLFARIGVESARYSRLHTTKGGTLYGIGFQSYVSDHVDLRGEYDYDTNKSLNQYSLDLVYKFQ